MSVTVALPADLTETAKTILTFVVPAPNGCNLNCAFCYIKQRKEQAEQAILKPQDYSKFIKDIHKQKEIGIICIQGYEPLLPESFDYSRTILKTGLEIDTPVSLITNGVHLGQHARELSTLQPAKILVSLDSHLPDAHDRQRGKTGAFGATVDSIQQALEFASLTDVIGITSVLIPKKKHQLIGMPKLLSDLGIKRWIVNPLLKVGGEKDIGGLVGNSADLFVDLMELKNEADRHSVNLIVDDEFDRLNKIKDNGNVVDINHRRFLTVQRLRRPAGVFRLLPTGECSVGFQLLKEVGPATPRWAPMAMNAFEFIDGLSDDD